MLESFRKRLLQNNVYIKKTKNLHVGKMFHPYGVYFILINQHKREDDFVYSDPWNTANRFFFFQVKSWYYDRQANMMIRPVTEHARTLVICSRECFCRWCHSLVRRYFRYMFAWCARRSLFQSTPDPGSFRRDWLFISHQSARTLKVSVFSIAACANKQS